MSASTARGIRGFSGLRALALAAACACSSGEVPATGEMRVLSLAPGVSRVLLEIGAADLVVGVDRYSREVEAFEDRPELGGLFAPDLERAIELRPTLALGVRSAQQGAFFDQLRSRGIATYEIEAHTLEGVLLSFREIGARVDRAAEAEALIARVRGELEAVAAGVGGRERRSVALVIHRDPLYVVGAGSFAHTLIDTAGGRNVFADLDAPYPQVSLELLAERAPDVIVDTSTAGDAVVYWSRFSWVERVETLPPGEATLPSPALAGGARLLRSRIHPEIGQ